MVELRWERDALFGKMVGGIFGHFGTWFHSRGAYVHASAWSVSIQVFGDIGGDFGRVDIPADFDNVLAIRDALNRVIEELEQSAEMAVLVILRDHPGLGRNKLSRFVDQVRLRRMKAPFSDDETLRKHAPNLDRLNDRVLAQALERLKGAGFVESHHAETPLFDALNAGVPLITYYLTEAGAARLEQLTARMARMAGEVTQVANSISRGK